MPSVRPVPIAPPAVVRRIDDLELRDAVLRLRVASWAAQGVRFEHERDGRIYEPLDEVAEHYGVVEARLVLAAVRISFHESIESVPLPPPFDAIEDIAGPIAFLSRLVVRAEIQHRGYGTLLTDHVIRRGSELGAHTLLAFTTVTSRARHLRALGFAERAAAIVPWGQRAEHGLLLLRSVEPTRGA